MGKPENWKKMAPLLALIAAAEISACNPEKTSATAGLDGDTPQEIRLNTQRQTAKTAAAQFGTTANPDEDAKLDNELRAAQFEIWAFEFKETGVAVKFSSIDDLRAFFTLRSKGRFFVENIEFQLSGLPEPLIHQGNYVLLPLDKKQLAALKAIFIDFANRRLPPLILEIK